MLRKISKSKRAKIKRNGIEKHSEKLHNLHSTPNIVRMTKSRKK
jgi:hypothetical protein